MLFLFVRQAKTSRTASGILRVSRWTFLAQTTMDAVSFSGHITFAILAEGRTSLSLVAPAFLACILFISQAVSRLSIWSRSCWSELEQQLSASIYQIQGPEVYIPPAATRPQTQNTSSPSDLPTTVSIGTPAPQQPATLLQAANTRPPASFLAFFIHHIRTDPQARMCKVIRNFIVRIFLTLPFRVNSNYLSDVYCPRNLVSTAFVNFCRYHILFYLGTSNCPIGPSRSQQRSFQKLHPWHHHLSIVKRRLWVSFLECGCSLLILCRFSELPEECSGGGTAMLVTCRSPACQLTDRRFIRLWLAWVWLFALVVYLQAFVVILQDVLGPTFFLPWAVRVFLFDFWGVLKASIHSLQKPRHIITTLTCLAQSILNNLWEIVRSAWKPFSLTHHFQVARHPLTWSIKALRKGFQSLHSRAAGMMHRPRAYSAELWGCSRLQKLGRTIVSRLVVIFLWEFVVMLRLT